MKMAELFAHEVLRCNKELAVIMQDVLNLEKPFYQRFSNKELYDKGTALIVVCVRR